MTCPWRDDRGIVGGAEVLPFGLLIFVSFTLVLVNAWSVVDAKFAVDAAAREGARAYAESTATDQPGAIDDAQSAALVSLTDHGRSTERVQSIEVVGRFERCAPIEVEVVYRVPAIRVPFIGGFGSGIRVTSNHSEIVDPYRDGVAGTASC